MAVLLRLERSMYLFEAEEVRSIFVRTVTVDPLRRVALLSLAYLHMKVQDYEIRPEETETLSLIPGFLHEWTVLLRSSEFKARKRSPGNDPNWSQWIVRTRQVHLVEWEDSRN